ncbi:MAG: hypothetical protein Q8Q10_04945 [bacterium]|nr:hypothetical protein [bacterium]
MSGQTAKQMDLDFDAPKKLSAEEIRRKCLELHPIYQKNTGVNPVFKSFVYDLKRLEHGRDDPEDEKKCLHLEELGEPNANLPFTPKRR